MFCAAQKWVGSFMLESGISPPNKLKPRKMLASTATCVLGSPNSACLSYVYLFILFSFFAGVSGCMLDAENGSWAMMDLLFPPGLSSLVTLWGAAGQLGGSTLQRRREGMSHWCFHHVHRRQKHTTLLGKHITRNSPPENTHMLGKHSIRAYTVEKSQVSSDKKTHLLTPLRTGILTFYT